MRRLVSLAVATALFALATPSRADAATDLAEKIVSVVEHAATVAEMNKDKCDVMGDKLGKLWDDNAQLFQRAKETNDKLTPTQRQVIEQRFQARTRVAMQKLMPPVMSCRSNAKVASVISRAQSI